MRPRELDPRRDEPLLALPLRRVLFARDEPLLLAALREDPEVDPDFDDDPDRDDAAELERFDADFDEAADRFLPPPEARLEDDFGCGICPPSIDPRMGRRRG